MAQAKPPGTEPETHPVVTALRARAPWEPRPFTRTMSRISPGTRSIAEQVNPREEQWAEIAAAALATDLPVWVVLGDSIAQGIGASDLPRSWVARVAGALAADGRPHAVVNLSRSGARTDHVRNEQIPLLEHLDVTPALITCGVGSNDLMRNPSPAAVANRITALMTMLPPAVTVFSTLPSPSLSPTGLWVNRAIRRTAADRGMRVADVVPHMSRPRASLAADRFHPSDHGYRAWVLAHRDALAVDPEAVPDEWELRPAA